MDRSQAGRLLPLMLALALAGAEETPPPQASAALLARIAAAQQAVATVQGRASWRTRRSDEPAAAARVQEVRFFLQFPDRYCLVFTKPGDEDEKQSFLSDGIQRWELHRMFKDDPPDEKVAPVGRDDAEFKRLLACFRLDLRALDRDFTLVATPGAAGARVVLTPSRPEIAEQLSALSLEFDSGLRLTHLAWDDPQGNHCDVAIDEASYGQPIPATVFHYAKPGE